MVFFFSFLYTQKFHFYEPDKIEQNPFECIFIFSVLIVPLLNSKNKLKIKFQASKWRFKIVQNVLFKKTVKVARLFWVGHDLEFS